MNTRRWLLLPAVVAGVLLVGALATIWFVVAQEGWDGFREAPVLSHGGWGALAAMAVFGVFVSQPLASAWFLSRTAPGPRPWRMPLMCAGWAAFLAMALAWSVEVMRVRWLRDVFIYAVVAGMWFGVPLFLAGLIGRHHMRTPERAWFFRPFARTAFAISLMSGMLQMSVLLDMSLFQWKVVRAKAYVEEVAREVERASDRGRPPEDISGILARHRDPPGMAAGENLKYERGEDSFRFEFFCGHDWIKGHYWTYRSPPGTWKKRRY